MSAIEQAPTEPEAVTGVSTANQAIPSVPNVPVKSDNIFNGVHFCLCDDVKDIDEVIEITHRL